MSVKKNSQVISYKRLTNVEDVAMSYWAYGAKRIYVYNLIIKLITLQRCQGLSKHWAIKHLWSQIGS